jgi:hypothetical protein
MSILLSTLVARLQEDVPAEDGVPSETQYENAIQDAVRDFSERCGLEQIGTLNVVSGTSTYDLPADFLRMIRLETIANLGEGVLHSADGLIPVSVDWCEKHTIRNGQITFYPIPRYSMARDFHYKAAWIGTDVEPEGSGDTADIEYETMGEREARIVLLKAQAIALTKQVNATSGDVLKYSLGAVSVDKGSNIEERRRKSETFDSDYLDACAKYNGAHVAYG